MCGDFIDEFYQDEIDIPALLRDLKLNKGSLFYNFDATKYLVNSFSVFLVPTMVSPVTPIPWKDSSKPYKYRDRNGTEKECDFEGIKLNKRVCLIEDSIAFSISFDGSKFKYELKIKYRDVPPFDIKDLVETSFKGDFSLSDKYFAVNIPTNDIEDVYELYKQYYGSTYNLKWLEDYISYRILDIYNKTNSISKIKSIYEEAPIFALQKLGDSNLFKDLKELLKYDKGNWIIDGWFKDSSNAIIKLLSSFNNLDNLYDYLYNNVKNLMVIYNHLDKKNCIALGQIIDMLIMYKRLKDPNFRPNIAEQEYILGGDYSIDSDIFGSILNRTPEKVYLRNLVEKTEIDYNAKTGLPYESKKQSTIYENEFHPFTLIPIKETIGDKENIEYLSALLVKAKADDNEWKDVANTAQIVANLLAIIISIATFGTATPFAMALLALEIGVTAADIYVISIQKELEQTEGGCEFLEKWNKFMLVGAVVTAGPALFKGTLQLGSRILKSTASQATKHFVTKCIATAILERNIANFAKSGTKTTIKEAIILNDSINSSTSVFSLSKNFLDELYKNGAYILKSVTNEGKESYHLIYKGEILEKTDNVIEIEKSLKDLANKKGTQLTKSLDKLERLIPKLSDDNKYWTCFNNAGTELRWGFQHPKSINNSIESAINNANAGKKWEGKVANAFKEIDEIKQVGTKIEWLNTQTGKFELAGDFDVLGEKYLVECKSSLTKNTLRSKDFKEQLLKYIDASNTKFVNIENKNVVIAIEELKDFGIDNIFFTSFIEIAKKNKIKLEFITSINQINKLK